MMARPRRRAAQLDATADASTSMPLSSSLTVQSHKISRTGNTRKPLRRCCSPLWWTASTGACCYRDTGGKDSHRGAMPPRTGAGGGPLS